jgi:hypothetical protein
MRNWAWARKGGGAENAILVRSVAVKTVVTVAAIAGTATAIRGPAATRGEEAGATATLSSRLPFGLDIVQLPAQHGIDIDAIAILPSGCPRQHAVAAGSAMTNKRSATVMAVANLAAIDLAIDLLGVLTGFFNSARSIDISSMPGVPWYTPAGDGDH